MGGVKGWEVQREYGMEIRRGKWNRMNGEGQREGDNYTEQRGMDKIKFMVLFYLMYM